MVSRRRNHSEANAAPAQQNRQQQPAEEPGLLHRLRNCWEFANLMQYLSMFGKIMKIDEDFGIEVYILSRSYRIQGLLCAREVQAKD